MSLVLLKTISRNPAQTGILTRYRPVVRYSLVVTFVAIRMQGLRFKPRTGQKFETRFLLHAHPCSASGITTSGTRASPKPGNSLKKVKGRPMGADTSVVKKKQE